MERKIKIDHKTVKTLETEQRNKITEMERRDRRISILLAQGLIHIYSGNVSLKPVASYMDNWLTDEVNRVMSAFRSRL